MWKRKRREWRCKTKGIRMEPDLVPLIIKQNYIVDKLRCNIRFEPWHWDHLKEMGDDTLTEYLRHKIAGHLFETDDFWKYVTIDISEDYLDYPSKVATATLQVISLN